MVGIINPCPNYSCTLNYDMFEYFVEGSYHSLHPSPKIMAEFLKPPKINIMPSSKLHDV